MNGPSTASLQRQAHPSAHRRRVSGRVVAFGLLGAPAAWSPQLLVNAALDAHGCYPRDTPLDAPVWPQAAALMGGLELVAVLLCVAALGCAWAAWRRTRDERPGSAHRLLEAGDGRSRFMALSGLLTSALFLLAVLLSAFNLVVLPACGGAS